MTSANVTEYTIFKDGQKVGEHRQHHLCKSRAHELLKYENPHEYTIKSHWEDEEEEYHEGPIINLRSWLVGNRLMENSIAVAAFEEHRNCSVERFNRAIERADRFVDIGAIDVAVWYDEYEDYVRVEFTLQGDKYSLRSYKVHTMVKNDRDYYVNTRTFPHEHAMFYFFETKQYRNF